VLATAVTHNDPAAIGLGIAFSTVLVELLTWKGHPNSSWWIDTFVKFAREIEGDNRMAPRWKVFREIPRPVNVIIERMRAPRP
jgi:hypothetical protein